MKTRLFLLPIVLAPFSLHAAEPQNGSGETDGYRIVWQDLFDGDEINPFRWDIEVNGSGGGNQELQYYTDRSENIRLGKDNEGNGCLILTARRENYSGKQFTSGRINTKNRIAFTHGKLEASIRLDSTADGLWPAFWTMGNDFDAVGWPKCGETDIMEFGHADGIRNNTQDRYFNGASHWGTAWNRKGDYARSVTKNYSLQDGKFHLYTMIWDENSIRMYVDLDVNPIQTPYYQIDISRVDPSDDLCAGNYFHKENFIIFNLAVGGNFPNIHKAEEITALNEGNGQQASMYVNYVKIYQKGLPSENTNFLDPGDDIDHSYATSVSEDNHNIHLTKTEYYICAQTANGQEADIEVFCTDGTLLTKTKGNISLDTLPKGLVIVKASACGHTHTTKKFII